jgi:hypothetical protein
MHFATDGQELRRFSSVREVNLGWWCGENSRRSPDLLPSDENRIGLTQE